MAEDKWYSRALPIMEVVSRCEDDGRDLVQVGEIAEGTGLEPQAVLAELKRLVTEGFVGGGVSRAV